MLQHLKGLIYLASVAIAVACGGNRSSAPSVSPPLPPAEEPAPDEESASISDAGPPAP
jgi:hypothetical protein